MAESRKRCSWVHEGMIVTPTGDVFACCHHKPGVVGNINENTLEEIFNGDRIKEFRQQEIDGTLPCLKTCILGQREVPVDDTHHDYRTGFHKLQLEFGERCNIRCIMCPQDHKSTLELDPETLVRNIEIPPSCTDIRFYGGEPTILKSAKKMLDHCIEQGAKMTILTNGATISDEMAAKLAVHAKVVSFSLNAATKETHEIVNAGSRFEKVLRNIKRVVSAKEELKGKAVIVGHMTIVEQNVHEIAQFIAKREEFGFEVINFGFDWRVPRMLAKDPALKARLADEVQETIAQAVSRSRAERLKIQTERLELLDLFRHDLHVRAVARIRAANASEPEAAVTWPPPDATAPLAS